MHDSSSDHPRGTIAFFPEGAFGPTNNCVGIGDVLRGRGHRVVFIVEESFAGTLEAQGFEERLMRLGPPAEVEEAPGQFWKDYVKENAPVFRKPTIEQLEGFIAPTFQALVDGAKYVDERLTEILDELRPDVVVEDNVVAFPALVASGRPWVRIVSCNPLEIRDPELPPPFSGYPTTDRTGWDEYDGEYRRALSPVHADLDDFCRARGAGALPQLEFIQESPWLNLYGYPAEVDYARTRTLAPNWHNTQASVRATESDWDGLSRLGEGDGALIYLSLGSLGSADVDLMRRLIGVLAGTEHRVVVSKGPRADEIELGANMVGDEFLPQTRVLPEVDLVITHGGNNTIVEALHFGKPMIVLPLFWDQHDNAQRMQETGYGARLPTYDHAPEELAAAVDRLLADRDLGRRLEACSRRLGAFGGASLAADLIERLAASGEPVAA